MEECNDAERSAAPIIQSITHRRWPKRHRTIQVFLVLVLVLTGLPLSFTAPVAANAVTAYGCTIDPEKPNEPGNKLVAKTRFPCASAWDGRAIRTELQQRRADGEWYAVAKTIVVRSVSGAFTGQWYGAGSDEVSCKKVSGARKFRSVIMITDQAIDI